MPDAFSLLVPLDTPYRSLATDLAGRYVELSGGSAEAAAALAAAVSAAVERLAAGAEPHAPIGLAFTPEGRGIRVELSCSGRRESLDVTLPVAKR